MASHLKPYRGKKATAESQNIVLKRGEVFFEVPVGGVGTGIGKIKMGDGTTAYSDLPYFSSVDDTVVSWTDTADTIDTTNNTNVALLNAFVPTKNVKSLFGTAKQLLVNLDRSVTVLNNKKVDLSNYRTKTDVPFLFGIDASGNYGYKKAGADTVIPFKSQVDIDNAYNKGITDGRVGYYTKSQYDNAYNTGYNKGKTDGKTEYSSIFGDNRVGDSGIIIDNTYNVRWVIYRISGNTYQLFPMRNLTEHYMGSSYTNADGYYNSDMYSYIHNTVLPNLRNSSLNITACDLVSQSEYNYICSKTGITSATIAGGEDFWLADHSPNNTTSFYYVNSGGSFIYDDGNRYSHGVRPLITVII